MTEPGLRARKKQQMYQRVSEIAIRLFLEKGFDAVSVAEVAAAAGISKPTLFRYFPAKEDLVLHRIADHEGEAARVVGGAAEPVAALREHFLRGLEQEDPVTGLSDHPQVLAFHRLLYGTPALLARVYTYQQRAEAALAEVLGGGVDAQVAAAQIVAVQRVLAMENWRRIAGGEGAGDVREDAVAAAERAFGALERALPHLEAR